MPEIWIVSSKREKKQWEEKANLTPSLPSRVSPQDSEIKTFLFVF